MGTLIIFLIVAVLGFILIYKLFISNHINTVKRTTEYEITRDNNTTMTLDEWRGTISKYALAKNNRGEYIYDETVAESFHDVYLNKNNASDASKYVVAVLKKRLES